MNYILFDGPTRNSLLPFTFTKPVSEIRVGVMTIKEKWEKLLGSTLTYLTEEYLEAKYPMVEFDENVYIDASVMPTKELATEISFIAENQMLMRNDDMIAFFASKNQEEVDFESYEVIEFKEELFKIETKSDIFSHNYQAINDDFQLLTENRSSVDLSDTNTIIGPAENVFLEAGAAVECVVINATEGPVYIGEDAVVMEGSLLRGPIAIGEKAVVKMGAKIYSGTTIGPNCTVGGEIKNVVFFGNSNKGHDGYLGNSVVGEWCNFGADTNVSNMKNNHSEVSVWDYAEDGFMSSGLKFCGLFLGDYSKLGINTMINTGTVIGVSSNVFGSGFPDKFIPSFSWGGKESLVEYKIDKALNDAKKMRALKKKTFEDKDQKILEAIFEETKTYRP